MKNRIRMTALLALVTAGVGALPAHATPDAELVRVAGTDRYGTANGVAASEFDDVNVAVVATGEAFADALAANYLAGAYDAPMLLTPTASMAPGLPDALESIGAEGVQVMGGASAVSDTVVAQLQAEGYEVTRIAGANRYATARAIAELLPPEAVSDFQDKGRTAIIVSGENFADALSAGPMSYAQGWPILLTDSARLHGDAGAAIRNLGIEHAIIVGGTGSVSEAAVADLTTLGVTSQRLAGSDRTITAQAVANFVATTLGYGGDDVAIARSDVFPDALAAGPRAGTELMPILLTASPTDLGAAAAAWITDNKGTLDRIEVYGGTAAVSEGVANQALTIARS